MSTLSRPLIRTGNRFPGSIIDASTSLLAKQTHDVVRFAMGAPSTELIPVPQLNDAFSRYASNRYDYGESEGEPALREEIVRMCAAAGIETSFDRVLVTTGGMQGLDLAFKLFVQPNDLVMVEAPTYTNGYATAKSYGADVFPVPIDENGMRVDLLPDIVERLGRTPRVIYTIPNFQNPTGVTLSLSRRKQLLELAERWGAVILDDDPYGQLRFSGEAVPSFLELAPNNPHVFQVRTFSKIIAPGLRTGWIDVDPEIHRLAVNARQAMDTCSNVPTQLAVADYLSSDHLNLHLDLLRPIYKERKEAMLGAISKHMGPAVISTNPEGGFFLWLTLDHETQRIDTTSGFTDALKAGVAYIPGSAFTTDGSMRNTLRLCFATSSPERIDTGVSRLASVFRHYT